MAKDDWTLTRLLELGVQPGPDVWAVKRMISRAGVGYPLPEKRDDGFGERLKAAVEKFQAKNGLVVDGQVGYMTLKELLHFAKPDEGKLLRQVAKATTGDWGILGRKSAWAGIDMGVDFLGKGPIPMFADGVVVRVVRSGSGWPGEGGLIVVQCDSGPMAKHPIYVAEDIRIPAGHKVGTRLKKGDLLAEATGSRKAPGIELGWAGPPPDYRGTLFNQKHGKYTMHPRDTAEGHDFWKTLSAHIAKGM